MSITRIISNGILAMFCFAAFSAAAQDFDKFAQVSYNINKPLSNTGWIDATSTQGFKFVYRSLINDRFLAGLDFSWASYDQYQPTVTIERPAGAVTTDYFKYVYSYSLALAGEYILPVGNKDVMLPFAGLGVGAAMNSFTTYYNVYQNREDVWGVFISPRAGVIFPFSSKVGAMVGIHYDYSTTKSDDLGYDNFSNIGVQVGITLMSY